MSLDKVAALESTVLFGSLDPATLAALANRAIERRLAAGEILFLEGEPAAGLYVIVEGAVRAFRTGPDGREQVIHVETAGATIAEVPVFDEGAYPSTVAADVPSELLFIAREDVRQLSMDHPEIALAALRVLAARLRHCAALVETLSLREVGPRLARFLLEEARARGRNRPEGIVFDLPLSREQVAARVGSVREVVSRAISRMQQEGLIRMDGRRVTVPDADRLAAYAGDPA